MNVDVQTCAAKRNSKRDELSGSPTSSFCSSPYYIFSWPLSRELMLGFQYTPMTHAHTHTHTACGNCNFEYECHSFLTRLSVFQTYLSVSRHQYLFIAILVCLSVFLSVCLLPSLSRFLSVSLRRSSMAPQYQGHGKSSRNSNSTTVHQYPSIRN